LRPQCRDCRSQANMGQEKAPVIPCQQKKSVIKSNHPRYIYKECKMVYPLFDKHLVEYDECGKALFYITVNTYRYQYHWASSFSRRFKKINKRAFKNLNTFLFSLTCRKIFYNENTLMAIMQETMHNAKAVCDNWAAERISEMYINEDGTLNTCKMSYHERLFDQDPDFNYPYTSDSMPQHFIMMKELLIHFSAYEFATRLHLSPKRLSEKQFVKFLVNDELKNTWLDVLGQVDRYIVLSSRMMDGFMALDLAGVPVFFFFRESEKYKLRHQQ